MFQPLKNIANKTTVKHAKVNNFDIKLVFIWFRIEM